MLGCYSVFLGICLVYKRYIYYYTSGFVVVAVVLLLIRLLLQGILSRKPRRVKGKLFFLPQTHKAKYLVEIILMITAVFLGHVFFSFI